MCVVVFMVGEGCVYTLYDPQQNWICMSSDTSLLAKSLQI